MSKNKTVTAIYENMKGAKGAILHLKKQGVRASRISLLGSENSLDKDMKVENENDVAEAGALGAATGAALGASFVGLTTFTTASLTGGAALLGAGPLVSAIAGATAGATAGGLVGGFVGVGIPEIEARHIEEKLNQGYFVVGVDASQGNEDLVKELLQDTEGERVVVH